MPHTPGPWTWSWEEREYGSPVMDCWVGSEDTPVAMIGAAPADADATAEEVTESNARLIAAAPDLLAACDSLAWEFEQLAAELLLVLPPADYLRLVNDALGRICHTRDAALRRAREG